MIYKVFYQETKERSPRRETTRSTLPRHRCQLRT